MVGGVLDGMVGILCRLIMAEGIVDGMVDGVVDSMVNRVVDGMDEVVDDNRSLRFC